MVLNLRDLLSPIPLQDPALSFVCHGQKFTARNYLENEFGYQDAMAGVNPSNNSVAYRKGYLEFLLAR